MSATGRGAVRHPDDFYATSPEDVDHLLDAGLELPGGQWLEPCAGHSAIIDAVSARRPDVIWDAVELREEEQGHLVTRPTIMSFWCPQDFLSWPHGAACAERKILWSVGCTNPPFNLAADFLLRMRACCEHVVLLTRLNWLASKKRSFLSKDMPDVYVLEDRPSFCQSVSCANKKAGCDFHVTLPLDAEAPRQCPKCGGRTKITRSDATEYAWMHWHGPPRKRGRIERIGGGI